MWIRAKNSSLRLNTRTSRALKILEENFNAGDYEEKGLKSIGVRLASRETEKVVVAKKNVRGADV